MIEFKNVSFSYKTQDDRGIKNINLKINDGETVVFCGESGCGKSTILRLINGLIPHYYEGKLSGEVLLNGKNITEEPLYEIAKKVGSVFQNPRTQFFNSETTSEIVFGCENMALEKKEIENRLKQTVKNLNIANLLSRSLFELSGGEKQKIACASADAIKPEILVLDEPSSNLDIQAIKDLQNVIKNWKEQKKTIIVAEHRLYYVVPLADKIVYMKNGAIEKIFTKQEMVNLSYEKLKEMGLRSLNPFSLKSSVVQKSYSETFKIENMMFSYDKKSPEALNIPFLELPKGGVIGVLGNNGAGKSTFARCICGLNKKEKGFINFNNKSYQAKKRCKIAYIVMQDVNHQLFTDDVLEEVLISMNEEGNTDAENRANLILDSLDLKHKISSHPMSLSGGEKQRVAIASAIASDKELLIFDEPSSGLDYRHMLEVAKNIEALQKRGKTILLITHDPELIYKCCTHLLFLQKGEILWQDNINKNSIKKMNDFFNGNKES